METLNTKQTAALEALRAMRPFRIEVLGGDVGSVIRTGLNTAVLHSLRQKGAIRCTSVYLYGMVSADLEIVTIVTSPADQSGVR